VIDDYAELVKQKSDHLVLIDSESLMQIFNELLCMIVAQLGRSFVYGSSDRADDDVCSSHLSDLRQANSDDFRYEGSEV